MDDQVVPFKGLKAGSLAVASLAAGTIAAVIELVPVIPMQAKFGAPPVILFQSIASGILGKTAFTSGIASMAMGIAIHLLISVVAAATYVLAARFWDSVLVRKPWTCGLLFGVLVYVAMTVFVIPLSAIGYHPGSSIELTWVSLAVHAVTFGLPISLVTRWLCVRHDSVSINRNAKSR